MEIVVNAIGIIYGTVLILATFVRTAFTEAMRIDALFMPQPSETSRPLNLVIGLLVGGYAIYSLLYG